jgi:hypothetical protein
MDDTFVSGTSSLSFDDRARRLCESLSDFFVESASASLSTRLVVLSVSSPALMDVLVSDVLVEPCAARDGDDSEDSE